MHWLNEPASWQRTDDVLRVSVDPGTDFWRATGYGYIHDNGHVYGDVLPGDLDVSVRVRGTFAHQYDQAGVMLRADEQTWLKAGVEFFEGRPRLSTVLTLGWSSWIVADLPADLDEITLRMSRRGDAVEIRYAAGDGPAELAALVFMPPDREVLAGIMCAAPEGSGFSVTFHDLRIAGRQWGDPAPGELATGWDDLPEAAPATGWDDLPGAAPATGWDGQPHDGSPDWEDSRAAELAAGWLDGPGGPEGMPAEWADERPAGIPAGWGDDGHSADQLLDWAKPQATDPAADWDRLSGSLAKDNKQPETGGKEPGSKVTVGEAAGGEAAGGEVAGGEEAGGEAGGGSKTETASEPAGPGADDQTDPVLPAATAARPAPAGRKRSTPKLPVPRKPGPASPAGAAEPADAADEWISLLTADPDE